MSSIENYPERVFFRKKNNGKFFYKKYLSQKEFVDRKYLPLKKTHKFFFFFQRWPLIGLLDQDDLKRTDFKNKIFFIDIKKDLQNVFFRKISLKIYFLKVSRIFYREKTIKRAPRERNSWKASLQTEDLHKVIEKNSLNISYIENVFLRKNCFHKVFYRKKKTLPRLAYMFS